ncbi:MAG: hypothetical protein IT443_01445 [Phycisphaeraceae bacterium]|nr:hypothetical protein [Phycisphaeraceae bacterium]
MTTSADKKSSSRSPTPGTPGIPGIPGLSASSAVGISAEELAELLSRQQKLFEQLLDLASHQGPLIEAGQSEPLLNLLAQRQTLINQLHEISARLAPVRKQWAAVLQSFSQAARERIQGILDQIGKLQTRIASLDERDCQALRLTSQSLGSQMTRLQNSVGAMGAYRNQPTSPHTRLVDQKS